MILKNTIQYRIDAININTDEVILGCNADTIDQLSRQMPISTNGSDKVLMHSDIKNPKEWRPRAQALDGDTGRWVTIDDPRIHEEFLETPFEVY